MITSALLCLTLNIYHESRGESEEVQEAVAAVTMNRVREYRLHICKVVTSPSAFSWTRKPNKPIKEKIAFEKAKIIARSYLSGKSNRKVGGRLYFNEKRLGKRFKTKYKPIVLGKLVMY